MKTVVVLGLIELALEGARLLAQPNGPTEEQVQAYRKKFAAAHEGVQAALEAVIEEGKKP